MALLDFSLRECHTEDRAMLALVGAATFLESYAGLLPAESILWHATTNHSPEAYQRLLAQPTTRAWIAEVPPTWATGRGAPIGYALVTQPDFAENLLQPGDLELKRIYVFSRFHGAGVAQHLVTAALAAAQSAGATRLLLGTHRENRRALAFYRRNHFEQIGARTFQLGAKVFDDFVLARTL